ncbi:unnamed protein product [Chondrus crispus]|uniref:Uncharacterized protein n=1 Tax=Chondrus crispus TaxID=2769 RepID=R7Q505_CHOCR|nr:unnamed protein product [Chondrus crispus]CDF32446.1 unnamed protein product [Chondrus crispus]|eukprot:XP_005712111.1 unnamed protein product [Chondrus crispus]
MMNRGQWSLLNLASVSLCSIPRLELSMLLLPLQHLMHALA